MILSELNLYKTLLVTAALLALFLFFLKNIFHLSPSKVIGNEIKKYILVTFALYYNIKKRKEKKQKKWDCASLNTQIYIVQK